MDLLLTGIVIVTLLATAFNSYQIMQLRNGSPASASLSSGKVLPAVADVIPHGVPAVYGAELGVSFDDVSPGNQRKADATIKKLARLDTSIKLTNEQMKRYISVGTQIACEYCCNAKTLVFDNGQPACSCAHSYAMRGLARYLISQHGKEFSNEQILEELGKWKTLFFPGQIQAKARMLAEKGIPLNYVNLASNKYRGLKSGAGSNSNMVGGC